MMHQDLCAVFMWERWDLLPDFQTGEIRKWDVFSVLLQKGSGASLRVSGFLEDLNFKNKSSRRLPATRAKDFPWNLQIFPFM